MGLLTGTVAFYRYRVVGSPPPDFRARLGEAIARHAFRENDRARTREEILGWVAISDPGDTSPTPDSCLYGNLLVLSMRVDRKRVPVNFLKIRVERRVREEMEARSLQRIGASFRRELEEALEEELLGRALPVVATFDMVWDMSSGEVWFFGSSDLMCDLFRVLFKETFGLDIVRVQLSDWLHPAFSREELEELASRLQPTQAWRGDS